MCVCSYYYYYYYYCDYICVLFLVLLLLHMCAHVCPHGMCVCSYYYYTTTTNVCSSCYYIRVLIPARCDRIPELCAHIHTHAMDYYILHMCAHPATIYVSSYYYICVEAMQTHTHTCDVRLYTTYVCSSCYYICVLILLYLCPHATIYVSSYYCICVLILLLYMCPHTSGSCATPELQRAAGCCTYIYVFIYNIYMWCLSAAAVRRQLYIYICIYI